MYSNKRRSHVHFVRQFETTSGNYTGTRVVIYIKGGPKLIYDYDRFVAHRYENSKNKIHSISKWEKKECTHREIIKKEMGNYSLDKKYKMLHVLYESQSMDLQDLIEVAFTEEGLKKAEALSRSIVKLSNKETCFKA